jgi:hypothetical protein
MTTTLERGNEALAAGAWTEARTCFAQALESSDTAELWEGLSWAAWWLEDGTGSIEAREQAYRRFKQRRDLRGAGRMAIWLAMDHVEFRSEFAVAEGWFARCERILADLAPAPEHGWLASFQAAFAFDEGDSVTAGQLGTQARELGRELGLLALEMLGLATEGLALVTQGEVARGMRCLDEASAAAMGGEYEENFPICWTCCYLIYACEHVRDFDRAVQWCRNVERFAERRRINWVYRICRAHHAAVLTWHGDWEKAESELLECRRAIAATRPCVGTRDQRPARRSAPPSGPLRGGAGTAGRMRRAARRDARRGRAGARPGRSRERDRPRRRAAAPAAGREPNPASGSARGARARPRCRRRSRRRPAGPRRVARDRGHGRERTTSRGTAPLRGRDGGRRRR